MTHVGRDRENTHAKQHQGKAWATTAQQDWPVNMVINSRLLVCKAYGWALSLCQTYTKSRSLRSSFNNYPIVIKLSTINYHTNLSRSRVAIQVIIEKHKHNSLINIIPLSSLSYLRDDCHKQVVLIFESHGDSNRCTFCRGKSDQHVTRFTRSIRVGSPTIHLTWST
jgi:hypothetical protein